MNLQSIDFRDIPSIQIPHPELASQVALLVALFLMAKLTYKKPLHLLIKWMVKKMSGVNQSIKYPIISITRKIFLPLILATSALIGTAIFEHLQMRQSILERTGSIMGFYVVLKSLAILGNKGKSNFMIFSMLSMIIIQETGMGKELEKALNSVNFTVIDFRISLYKILRSMFMMFILQWFISVILNSGKKIIMGASRPKNLSSVGHEAELHYKIFNYIVYFLGFIILLTIVGIQSNHIALVGSAIGLGIGFGLQKIASNFLSGIILLVEKSVKLGDILELEGGQIGAVKSLGVRSVIVTTFDGKDLIIPNEILTTKEATNYTLTDRSIRLSASFYIVNKEDMQIALEIMRRACLMQKDISRNRKVICCARDTNEKGIHLMSLFWIYDFAQDDVLRIKSNVISATISMMLENNIELYFEKSLGLLRDTLHRVTDTKNPGQPPFVNRFANRPMNVKTQDTKGDSAFTSGGFSD